MNRVERSEIEAFLDRLHARDFDGAVALALGLVDEGVPVGDILRLVVAPAQVAVGERWASNEYSVADEHAATAVADAVVSLLAAERAPVTERRRVVVVCAEREWHLLPARLLVESLRSEGFDVTFLGGSMPPVHLAAFVGAAAPDVVGISCSTPLAFEGVLSCVEAVHDVGLPVIAGGRAFGDDDLRATVLGADLWAPDATAAAALLRQPLPGDLREPTADTGAAMELALRRSAWVDATMGQLTRELPGFASFSEAQRERTREDVRYILQFAEAAVLTRDPRVFHDFTVWLGRILSSRGLPPSVLSRSYEILAQVTAGSAAMSELLGSAPRDLAP